MWKGLALFNSTWHPQMAILCLVPIIAFTVLATLHIVSFYSLKILKDKHYSPQITNREAENWIH